MQAHRRNDLPSQASSLQNDWNRTATPSALKAHISPNSPFPVPENIDSRLERVRSYWNALKRGGTDIPFLDDLKLSEVSKFTDTSFLLDVFEKPQRFRFESVRPPLIKLYGGELLGMFVDELSPRSPFDYFSSQCSATVEACAPTFYRYRTGGGQPVYDRLMLPLWAYGHIAGLIGATRII